MSNGTLLAVLLMVCGPSSEVAARICLSTGNGNWTHAATWSCASTPLPGDTIIIQAGHTVTLSNNLNYTGTPMLIQVYGDWQFNGGGSKITLPCGSYIEILEGGTLHPDPDYNGFSETVRICNVTYWNTTMGPQDGYVIWPPPPYDLPVELVDFNARDIEASIVVDWITASEQDVDHFKVYRSQDMFDRTFIGTVAGSGTSNTMHKYEIKDIPLSSGHYYYFLEEVNRSGVASMIGTTAVLFQRSNSLLGCMPNPLSRSEALTVHVPGDPGGVDVRLIGTEGRWIHPSSVEVNGTVIVVMDGLRISSGIYTLQALEGGRPIGTCRFILE